MKVRHLLLSALLLGPAFRAGGETAAAPLTMEQAVELCEEMPLGGPEGIWEYPDDNVRVLLLRDEADRGRFRITVIDAEDCDLHAGDVLGYLESTPDPLKFKLCLNTVRRKGMLTAPRTCLATFSKEHESIRVQKASLSVTLNPLGLLPKFWRIARVRLNDPLKNLPEGMVRIFPSYDGNGSSRRQPRYL